MYNLVDAAQTAGEGYPEAVEEDLLGLVRLGDSHLGVVCAGMFLPVDLRQEALNRLGRGHQLTAEPEDFQCDAQRGEATEGDCGD